MLPNIFIPQNSDISNKLIYLDVVAILIGYGFEKTEAQHLATKFSAIVEEWFKNGN